jgi:peroxiredoxin Q/BCP
MEEAASRRSPVLGKPATDFTLPEVRGSTFKLSAERGKWVVLYFYPQADTPGCTCQATEFTALLAKFAALDAEVVGVAPDSAMAIEFFADKYKLQIRLLSDESKDVMRQYGAWVDQTVAGQKMGRVVRSTFLISPTGQIAWHWPEVIPEGHAERVRLRLEQLRNPTK